MALASAGVLLHYRASFFAIATARLAIHSGIGLAPDSNRRIWIERVFLFPLQPSFWPKPERVRPRDLRMTFSSGPVMDEGGLGGFLSPNSRSKWFKTSRRTARLNAWSPSRSFRNRLISWSSVSSGNCTFRLRISSNASLRAPVNTTLPCSGGRRRLFYLLVTERTILSSTPIARLLASVSLGSIGRAGLPGWLTLLVRTGPCLDMKRNRLALRGRMLCALVPYS